jgi:hypothetical protein
MVAEGVVQSLGEEVEEEPLRQEEAAAEERRIGLGLLQHVSSDLVLESDLHNTVDTRRHSYSTLVLSSGQDAFHKADLLSISSIGGIGIGAIIVLSILSSIVGCCGCLAVDSWGGAVGGTSIGIVSIVRIV